MDKQKEIAALRSLAEGDTYFRQFFKGDIEQMCENIKNDFPIEFGCHFIERAAQLEKQLIADKAYAAEELEDMVANFIMLNRGTFTPEFYHYCAERVGKLFIIKVKREQCLPLTEDEIDHLINIADRHINPELHK